MKSVRMFVVLCLLAALGTAVASGCGSSPAGGGTGQTSTIPVISQQAKNLDPCSLLSKEDVAGIIGQKVQDLRRTGTSCSYDSNNATKFQSVLVVAQAGTMDDFNYQKKVLGDNKARDVGGIGDAAAFLTDTQIVALKKDVLINITGFDVPADQLQALAKKAADQVQG